VIWSEPVSQADWDRARLAHECVGKHQLFPASWSSTSFLGRHLTLLRPFALSRQQVPFPSSVDVRLRAVHLDRLLTGRTDGHPFVLHRSHLASVRTVRPVFEAAHFLARVAREGQEVQLSSFRVRAPRAQVRQLGRGDPTDQRVSVNHQILHGSLFFAGLLPRHSSMEVCSLQVFYLAIPPWKFVVEMGGAGSRSISNFFSAEWMLHGLRQERKCVSDWCVRSCFP